MLLYSGNEPILILSKYSANDINTEKVAQAKKSHLGNILKKLNPPSTIIENDMPNSIFFDLSIFSP
jgi:hypothetical protein